MISILEEAADPGRWQDFLTYRTDRRRLSPAEEQELRDFVERGAYLPLCELAAEGGFPGQLPCRKTINKEGSRKKRVVYSFPGDAGIFLKFIAWRLSRFDAYFSENCYSFRQGHGVQQAIRRLRRDPRVPVSYCLKIDISDYFNSIDVDILLDKLDFVRREDPRLYGLFASILTEPRVMENGRIVPDRHGAMAGIPVSPFFANVYLTETDRYFAGQDVLYFRYSDDILLFAPSMEELERCRDALTRQLSGLGLSLNPDKVRTCAPGEPLEFLGFSYHAGQIDLSGNTIRKAKRRIRRKAAALRRWQRRKGLSPDKAAIGLIHAMNRKFFGGSHRDPSPQEAPSDDFTWCRWFFPNLTTDAGLKEIDACMQQYIRYCVTGRHYKGNYRIRYETMKQWGYRSLVHEYYRKEPTTPQNSLR